MTTTAADLAIAQSALDNEATTLQALIAQTASGGASALATLGAEYQTAQALIANYTSQVTGLDLTLINTAMQEAGAALGGQLPAVTTAGGTPSMISSAGIRIGSVVIPWAVVGAVALFAFTVWQVSKNKRRAA